MTGLTLVLLAQWWVQYPRNPTNASLLICSIMRHSQVAWSTCVPPIGLTDWVCILATYIIWNDLDHLGWCHLWMVIGNHSKAQDVGWNWPFVTMLDIKSAQGMISKSLLAGLCGSPPIIFYPLHIPKLPMWLATTFLPSVLVEGTALSLSLVPLRHAVLIKL